MSSRTITTGAEEVFPRSRLRKSFVVQNEDSTDTVFIKRERNDALTVSSTDHDHRLAGGSSISVNDLTDGKEAIQDRWTVIASANTPRISFFETEDVER